jgi:integrase
MPRQAKGARLWLEPEERDREGRLVHRSTWIIRDGTRKIRTRCAPAERERAEQKLGEYLAKKYQPNREPGRDPSEILVLDVLKIYTDDVIGAHARPHETGQRLLKLAEFFRTDTLEDVTGARCREYVKWRTAQTIKAFTKNKPRLATDAAARRELEDLRAAINHHRREGLCSQIVSVVLTEKGDGRDVFLTRSEAARLLRAAWRAKQVVRDKITERNTGRHVARFILLGLYTGTRHRAICDAAPRATIGRAYVDLDRGVFYRRARGEKETNKRRPPAGLSDRLLAHLRRWERLGIANSAIIEWNGKAVRSIRKGFAGAVKAAGLPTTGPDKITPHTLRHTAATWAMQSGADPYQTAGMLGMTVEMLLDRYGHHHPDFQRAAANKLANGGRLPGQFRDRNTVNKTRRTSGNATKITDISKVAQ